MLLALDKASTETSELTKVRGISGKDLPDSEMKKEIGNLPEQGALESL